MQVREIGSGATQREARQKLLRLHASGRSTWCCGNGYAPDAATSARLSRTVDASWSG